MGYRFTDSTNRVVTGLQKFNMQRSYSFWTYRIGNGGGTIGRFFSRALTGGNDERMFGNGSTQTKYTIQWSGSNAEWASDGVLLNTWENWIVTYDATTTNKPIIYRNGQSVWVSTVHAPSGSVVTVENSNYIVGNSSVNTIRGFDGILSEFAVWDRILSPTEAYRIGTQRLSPAFIPKGLAFYLPMREDLQTRIAGNTYGYNTGAAITRAAHPKIVYPSEVIDTKISVPATPPKRPTLLLRRFV